MSLDGYNLGNAFGRIIISDNIDEALRNAQRSFDSGINNIGRSVSRLGDQFQQIGANLTLTLSPFTAFAAQAVNMAVNFESAFAGVAKTVDATDVQLDALADTIRRMATDRENPLAGLDNAHVTIAQIMELGGQLGVATDDLEKFAQAVGELTLATNLNAEEAALMIAQYANVSKMPIEDIDRFGAALVALGNNAATTESDIMRMASRIAAAAESVGFSEQQVLQFSSVLSSAGISAELGGTNFSIILTDITSAVAKGGGELQNFARIADMTASEFATAWETDAGAALEAFLAGLGEMTSQEQVLALEQLGFTGAEAQRVLRSLASNTEMLGDALRIASEGWRGFTTVDVAAYLQNFEESAKSLGFAADTTAESVQGMVSSIEDTATAFGFHGMQLYQYGAALANTGIQADIAGEAFAGIMDNVAGIVKNGGPQLEQFAQISGWTAEEVVRGWTDSGTTLQDFIGGLSKLTEAEQVAALERLGFTGQQTQEIMVALASDTQLLTDAWHLANNSVDRHNALTEEARKRLETTRAQFNVFKNNLGELALTIGEQLLPIVNSLMDSILDLVSGLIDWLGQNPELARTIGLIVTALGALGPSLFVIGRIMSVFGSSITGVISIVRLFGTVVMAVFSPVGAVIAAAIALGVALYAAWESNFLGIRDTLLPVIQAVGNALGDLIEWFGGLVDVFQAEGLSGAFNYLVDGIGNLLSGIGEAVRNVDWLELGASILRGIGDGITNVADWVYNSVIVPLAEGVALYITSGQLWEDLKRLGQGILDGIRAGIELIVTIQTWVWENLIVPLAEAVALYITSGQLWEDLKRLGQGIFTAIGEGFKKIDEIVSWVYARVILPMALAFRDYVTSGQLWEDLKRLGEGIFNGILEGIKAIGPIVEWIFNNVVKPAADAIVQYVGSGQLFEDAKALGTTIVDGILAGLADLGERLSPALFGPIGSLLDFNPFGGGGGEIGGGGGSPAPGWTGGSGASGNPEAAANTIGNLIGGIFDRDSGGPGMPGSIYRVGSGQVGQEFFGIGDAGHFYPDFAENLSRIAGAVMAREMAAGAAGAGVAEGRLSEQIIVNVTIPPGMLRDEAQLEENGRVFGRTVASEIRSRT